MKKEIKEFPGYFVTDDGRVFSHKRKKPIELKRQTNIDGYYVVNLFKDGSYTHCRVARLVAETFIENPSNLPIVNHIDHNRKNDNVTNLEWCDYLHNVLESQRLFPERWRGRADITEEDAHDICKLIEEGRRNKEICEILGTEIDVVKHIRRGDTWKAVSQHYKMTPSFRGISEETARWVCRMIADGLPNREIVRISTSKNVSKHIVKSIRAKRTWTEISSQYF